MLVYSFHDKKVYTVPVAEIEAREGAVARLPVPPQNTDPAVATRLELNPSVANGKCRFIRKVLGCF